MWFGGAKYSPGMMIWRSSWIAMEFQRTNIFHVLNSSRIDNKNIWEIASPSWWFLTHSTLWLSAPDRGILNAISKTHQSISFQTLLNGQCIRISVHKTATMHARKFHLYTGTEPGFVLGGQSLKQKIKKNYENKK